MSGRKVRSYEWWILGAVGVLFLAWFATGIAWLRYVTLAGCMLYFVLRLALPGRKGEGHGV
ncbi:hypothetical protein [uncultured Alistipes sp.]|uniref:hypothetical protein n=1 Tax=uncultured Alistipes sp. TaxID=538949 RepID=UPI0025EFD0DF|nr:hypothetical protein [uncultured Alistipes sp.]